MGLIYYKGEPYGDGSISSSEVLTFYAVEGEAPTSGVINKVDTGTVDEHGNPIYRVEIPMGTTIENAFATDTIETHIIEDTERVRLQANIGTRLKWGDRPEKGIIAGGLRVVTKKSVLSKTSTGSTMGSLANNSIAQEELFNYIYSNITFPKTTNFTYTTGATTQTPFSQATYFQDKNWKEYQLSLQLNYGTNSNDQIVAKAIRFPTVILDQGDVIIDDNKIISPTPQSADLRIYNSSKTTPLAHGMVLQLDSILELSDTTYPEAKSITYAMCDAYILGLISRESEDEYKFQITGSLPWTDIATPVTSSAHIKVYIPMSEDEIRYAMGVQDLFDQISYEEYIHHLPQG